MGAATPRQKTTVGVLMVVLVTVLWFQLIWRGQHEDSAGAVVDQSAAALVTEDTLPVDDPAALDDPTAPDDPTATPTTLAAEAIVHVAELRRVHEAVVASAGVRLTGYVPVGDSTAQLQVEAGYEGLVTMLAELRTRAPRAVISTIDAQPGSSTLTVTLTVEWAA